MYTDEHINQAVEQGLFSQNVADEFRAMVDKSNQSHRVDEENFRLISGFNDIFVVIACSLVLFSASWALKASSEVLALLVLPAIAWGLAEFFVRIRRMALPAIVLLLSFVSGVFALSQHAFASFGDNTLVISAALTAIAAYLHWLRFKVPITIAAGSAAIVGLIASVILSAIPSAKDYIFYVIFICGLGVFTLAMFWDSSDTQRTSRRSDVAFWLHLLSAPLIVHPVFTLLGITDGQSNLTSMIVVLLLYIVMTLVSITVDRRAFMVSSLFYVLYALSTLLKDYGFVGHSFAVTGVCIGSALLLLSAFWHKARLWLVLKLPSSIQQYIPTTH